MKKNVMMRLASFLLVAVLISTSAISGTYAKYVTEGSAQDDARVAKWGVTIAADYEGLFNTQYATTNGWIGDDGVSVNASADVVAPGTNGTLADFVIDGEPEVDVVVTYVADLAIGEGWGVSSTNNDVKDVSWAADTFYCPIIITVNGQEFEGLTYENAAEFEAAVEAKIAGATKQYNAGDALKNNVANDLAVTWQWAFDSTSVGDTDLNKDAYDTQLGDRAANDDAATIALSVTCTVTQID